MYHAITVEGVVPIFGLEHGIRAIAQISTLKVERQFTLYGEIFRGYLMTSRRIDTMQIGVVQLIDPGSGIIKLRDATETAFGAVKISEALCFAHGGPVSPLPDCSALSVTST